jgi:hypothetical protein
MKRTLPLVAVLLLSLVAPSAQAQNLITGSTTRGSEIAYRNPSQVRLGDITLGRTLKLKYVTLDGPNNKIKVDVTGLTAELNLGDASGELVADLKLAKVGVKNTASGGTSVFIEGNTGLVDIRLELGSARGMSAITGSTAFVDNPDAIPPTPWSLAIESRLSKRKIDLGGVVGNKVAFVDFSPFPSGTADTRAVTVKGCDGCDKNPHYKKSLRLLREGARLTLEATAARSKYVVLELKHLSSGAASCPNGGYSPVTIEVNGRSVAQAFSPAEHSFTVDTFDITDAIQDGKNIITITAARGTCTHYWLQGLAIYR